MRYADLICDLDGTLVDSAAGILGSALKVIEKEGLRAFKLPHDLSVLIGPPVPEILAKLLPEAPVEMINRLYASFRGLYDSTGWQNSSLYPQVKETLVILNGCGVKCYVVTNKPKLPTKLILDYLEIFPYFVETVSPDIHKPAHASKGDMLEYLIEKYDLCSDTSLFVGDTSQDGSAARLVGIKFAFVTYGYGKSEVIEHFNPEFILNRFEDIVPLILQSTA